VNKSDRHKTIIFERWLEPFLPVDEQMDGFDAEADWAFARRVFQGRELKPSLLSGRYLSSPVLGVFPLGEQNLPTLRNKLWFGHTDFRVTASDLTVISRVDGVEGLRQITPYRLWLMVGWAFKDEQVHEGVRAALNPAPPPAYGDHLSEGAARRFAAWAVVRTGPKSRDVVGGRSRAEVEGKLAGRGDVVEVLETSWGSDD
jgi:hypothetical protein